MHLKHISPSFEDAEVTVPGSSGESTENNDM